MAHENQPTSPSDICTPLREAWVDVVSFIRDTAVRECRSVARSSAHVTGVEQLGAGAVVASMQSAMDLVDDAEVCLGAWRATEA
jgi:hypothetical protein